MNDQGAFNYHHVVQPDEIDGQGHANNVVYVAWMQSAAIAHTTALGWPGERYRQLGVSWVARKHTIEYLQPAFAGEEIVVRTWVAWIKNASSLRCYRIERGDGTLLAQAETLWVFIDYATGRPRRLPKEVAAAFPAAPSEADANTVLRRE